MPIDQLPHYISQQIIKKDQVSQEIEKLNVAKSEMQLRVDNLEKKSDELQFELDQFCSFKQELQKYGIELDDIESLAKVVKGADQLGYDAKSIVSELLNYGIFISKKGELRESMGE
jgi:hypothetical protein